MVFVSAILRHCLCGIWADAEGMQLEFWVSGCRGRAGQCGDILKRLLAFTAFFRCSLSAVLHRLQMRHCDSLRLLVRQLLYAHICVCSLASRQSGHKKDWKRPWTCPSICSKGIKVEPLIILWNNHEKSIKVWVLEAYMTDTGWVTIQRQPQIISNSR